MPITKKKAPRTETDTRAWNQIYDDINQIIDAVNNEEATEDRGSQLGNSGDVRLVRDTATNKYLIEGKFSDGWAQRELFLTKASETDTSAEEEVSKLVVKDSITISSGATITENSGTQVEFSAQPKQASSVSTTPADNYTLTTKTYVDGLTGGNVLINSASDTNIQNPASGQILIYDGTDTWDNKTVQGHATIASNGAITVSEDAITGAMIDEATITGGNIVTGTITATQIQDATITGTEIASATITGANIGSATIAAANIASATITATQIANNTITADQIGSNTITAGEIASNAVTADEIASNTITAGNIASNTITADEIGTNAITADEIASNTITAGNIASNTITASEIGENAVTASEIASNTITAGNMGTNSIASGAIQSSAVTSGKIEDGAVTAGKISALSITAGMIANLTITSANIGNLVINNEKIATNTIDGADKIALNSITAAVVAAGTITADEVAANTLTANQIAANAITASEIAANAVTAAKISVTNLAAVSADMGSITAGSIDIGSGKAILASTGEATFADGRMKFHTNGIVSIVGTVTGSNGLVLYDPADSSPSHSGDNWSIFRGSNEKLGFMRNASGTGHIHLYLLENGNLQMQSGAYLWLGIGADAGAGFRRNAGHLEFYSGNGAAVSPTRTRGMYLSSAPSAGTPGNLYVESLGSGDVQSSAAGLLSVSSSREYKENMSTIPSALDKVMLLDGIYYDWKEELQEDMGSGRAMGFIAEDVKEVIPEATGEDSKGNASMYYGRMTALLVNAVKELKQEVEALKSN
jgi:hypothetical protein